jgi:hypothetical protein
MNTKDKAKKKSNPAKMAVKDLRIGKDQANKVRGGVAGTALGSEPL